MSAGRGADRHGMFPQTLCCALTALAWAQPRDTTLHLQDLGDDLQRIMEDERVFNEYYQCLLDLGPCNREATNFKDVIQEALERGCERCSAKQRQEAIEVLRQVMECSPLQYAEIERQFDPSGSFKDKYKMSLVARRCRH